MRGLDTRALLRVWENGARASHTMRGLLLMGAALPQVDADALMQASIGHRDAWLLSLREALFGPGIECLLPCPACGQQIELDFQVNEVRAAHAQPAQLCDVPASGTILRFRVPTSADLLAIESERDPQDATQQLLQRCWAGITEAPQAAMPQPLADEVAVAAAQAIGKADPQAEVLLAISCPSCGHETSLLFDIVSHLWRELDHWAGGMLRKVHAMASRYGWSEDSILGMSAPRRQAYLELIGFA